MLPLLLTAVHEGRLDVQDIVARCVDNPRRIYGLPEQPETWVEVDVDVAYTLSNAGLKTRVGWTPFAGRRVYGRVERVVLRGEIVYQDGAVLARPGCGRVLFQE
jgi:carbamoyl-phosphate synthase/aspartate carbamoyltransferase/dihydroorotase